MRSKNKFSGLSKRILFSLTAFVILTTNVKAQKAQLSIGDDAPALKYAKWIQGAKPVTAISKDKIYVIEFWATWCGPCIAAMPHLSELAKQYAGKVTFIGCNVWESAHGKDKNQESYLPKVTKFVAEQKKMGRLTYNVVSDNKAEDMGNGWLKAAGIGGIPSSFIVDKGKIAWIGHPIGLDSVLKEVLAGTFDVNGSKAKIEAQESEGKKMFAQMNGFKKAYNDADSLKQFDRAIAIADSAITAMPNLKFVFMADKMRMLIDHFGDDKAIAYGREIMKGTVGIDATTAMLYEKKDLSQKMKEFAFEFSMQMKQVMFPQVLNIQAEMASRAGKYKEAVELQTKAVDMAIAKKTDPQMGGSITDTVIAEYKQKLADYKKKM